MSINRNNYEEFFLLYVDNELSAAEKIEVENFVLNNEDLAGEFDSITNTILVPGNETFFSKANLYKTAECITPANCETYFLLYVDNELSTEEKYAVEKFVLQHPQTQANFSLLQSTKLVAEPVVFTNKTLLYKQQNKRVLWMNWSRIAIAALFAGVAVALYFLIPSNSFQKLQAGNKKPVIRTGDNTLPGYATNVSSKPNASIDTSKKASLHRATVKVPSTQVLVKNKQIAKQPGNHLLKSKSTENKLLALSKSYVADATINEKNLVPIEKSLAAEIQPQLVSNNIIKENSVRDSEAKALIQQTAYREIDTDADERDNSLLIGSARINKNKLRGLLKKATSLFDKKADKADNEKTIRIASFEIKGK